MTLILFSMVMGIWWMAPEPPKINLSHASAQQKLDYLVHLSQMRSDLSFFPLSIIVPFAVLLVVVAMLYILRPLFPAYTFYWGKEIGRYDRIVSLRGKIFWAVFIGILVGLAASYIFNVIPH
jgi:hypothetical protein